MRRIIHLLILITLLVAAFALLYSEDFKAQEGPHYYSLASPLRRFSSYEELKGFLNASLQVQPYYREDDPFRSMQPWSADSSRQLVSLTSAAPEYSRTNIQVEGVDEADVVKTDGEYIYLASGRNVSIVKAYPPEEAEVLSQIALNGALHGIFINGDRLALLETTFSQGITRTFIKIYDVSSRLTPILRRNISLDGTYFNSRMVSDYIYVVASEPTAFLEGEVPLPRIGLGDNVEEIDASKIYYLDVLDRFYSFTTVVAINVHDDMLEPTYETFMLGSAHRLYASSENIYIAYSEAERTLIYRVHIEGSNMELAAAGEVSGRVLNQFSMDEYNGFFRIATTTGRLTGIWGQSTSLNHIYVLDMELNIAGRLENLAPGEKIYSARFMGERCYLVTFRKVDPLFAIDLSDPYDPKVLGQLKITGYSDYLHPYDQNHIIGIGKETVADERGDFSWYQGVKISLFDVSNVEEPQELTKYIIGDRGTSSPVLADHKALLFDKARNLLVLPVRVAEIDEQKYPDGAHPSTFGEYVWQGAYVFNISLSQDLVLRSRITHIENDNTPTKGMRYFGSSYFVKRCLYIDAVLYTISDKKIKMNSLENMEEINEINLP